jgi:hypothetical protein
LTGRPTVSDPPEVAADHPVVLRGRFGPADAADDPYRHLGFDVPGPAVALRVELRY